MPMTNLTTDRAAIIAPWSTNLDVSWVYDKLENAVRNKNLKEIDRLLNTDFTVSKQFYQPNFQELIQEIFDFYNADIKSQKTIIDILRVFMHNGLRVNFIVDKENHRMIHLAIKKRMTEVIDFLISRKANLDVRNKAGNLMLHYSIEIESQKYKKCILTAMFESQSITFIEWIISKRLLQIDCQNEDGNTALHLAAKLNLLYVLPTLLRYTMDVTICNDRNLTAFQVFIESVTRMSDPNILFKPAHVQKFCEIFLEKGFSIYVIDEDKNTPLHCLLKHRVYNLAKIILEQREYVETRDGKGNTELNIVMSYDKSGEGDKEFVRILLSKEADVHKVNNCFFSPLITAVRKRKLSMLRIFKEYNVDFCHSYNGNYLWTYFFDEKCQSNVGADKDVLKVLVNRGCDVNTKGGAGMTALHLAARYGKYKLVEKLIKYGADIHCQSSYNGYTPLHVAAYHNNDIVMEVLVRNGANVNATCNKGQTPLHLCSKEATVKKLIELGAYVDIMDHYRLSPLHSAIEHQSGEAIKQLLKSGADFRDNAHFLNFDSYLSSSRYLSEHLIKLKAANLFSNERYDKVIGYGSHITQFNIKCLEEIKSLKNDMITDRLSMYDFLHMCRDSAYRHVEHDKLKKLFNSLLELEQQYPIYHGLLLSTHYTAIERRKIYEPAKDAFFYLTNTRLPDLCMNEIFSYLSNAGLRNIIEAVKKLK